MTDHFVKFPRLHPAQQEIVDHSARFKVLCCGRRFGKTATAIELLAAELLKGHYTAYFAPSQIMTVEVWHGIKALLRPIISRIHENSQRAEFLNGGLLECWTTRTENVRGRKYHFAVIDEAALIPSADPWNASIRPLLTDFRGHALFCSTPRGRNWFWALYNLGRVPNQTEWMSWSFPTIANPHIDPAEIEAARLTIPERVYQQEYLAQFLEDGGSVFRNIDAVCTAGAQVAPEIGVPTVCGVDWGRDNDFTCISVMDNTGRQIYLDRFNQISYNLQRDRLKTVIERYQPVLILAEANSIGSVNIDALQADGIPVRPFYTTGQSKGPLIEGLALAIERSQITLLNHPDLINELQAYEMSRSPSGIWQYSAHPGGNDDTVIATALSLWAQSRYSGDDIGFA